jgi:hypothetical protein
MSDTATAETVEAVKTVTNQFAQFAGTTAAKTTAEILVASVVLAGFSFTVTKVQARLAAKKATPVVQSVQ